MPSRSLDVRAALSALHGGGVVGMPTDTVYGLAASPGVEGATARLFELKERPPSLELPILVASVEQAACLAFGSELSDAARALAERFWPGPLTLVVRRAQGVFWHLGGDPSTVGIRIPDHELALEMCRRAGPLAVTSANKHGKPPLTSAEEVSSTFGEELEGVVDGGVCDGVPSTVVDLTSGDPRCIREGGIPWRDLLAVL